MILQFNKNALSNAIALTLVVLSAASYGQNTSSTKVQDLCCDTVKGKCVIPMPNRPSISRVTEPGRYGDLQKRLDNLDNGKCGNAYTLNKAQAWLNMSRDVMHEGNGATVVNASYEESEKLIKALEEGKAPSMDTALIAGADKLREDLWAIAADRKANNALLSSAAREVAYCEVSLVRAGHAQAKLGGKVRVEPLIGMAQDICHAAKDKPACALSPAPVVITQQPAPTPAPLPLAVAVTPVPSVSPQVAPSRVLKQDRN